jgi:hypothetical protein|tara:strand:- start:188 stop:361 length:174 start_codon:yes stop_codon:yes gene_type:complete
MRSGSTITNQEWTLAMVEPAARWRVKRRLSGGGDRTRTMAAPSGVVRITWTMWLGVQ